jgi:hypothetical protein
MQFLVAALAGALLQICASIVGRVLLALGLGFVAFTGINVLTDSVIAQVKNSFSGFSADVVSFLAFLWVDKALAVLFSAYTASATIKFAGGTTIKKLVMK